MTQWVIYLMESSVCMMFFWLVYWLFLRNETFYRLNRFYLLSTIALSLLIPVADWFYTLSTNTISGYYMLDTIVVTANKVESQAHSVVKSNSWLSVSLIVGSIFVFLFLFLTIVRIFLLLRKANVVRSNGAFWVVHKRFTVPFTFLKFIFIHPDIYRNHENAHVLAHELVHVKQRHTLDILLSGVVAALQWFNPFAWLYRESFREVHEFLADQKVLLTGADPACYKKAVYEQATGHVPLYASYFNVSFTKRRFIMMSKIKSPKSNALKVLFLIPVIGLMFVVFSCETDDNQSIVGDDVAEMKAAEQREQNTDAVQEEVITKEDAKNYDDPVYKVVEVMPEYFGGTQKLIADISNGVKYPQEAKEAGLEARVFCSFVIDKEGYVTNTKAEKVTVEEGVELPDNIQDAFKNNALAAVSSLGRWKPGEQDGEPVQVAYWIPISFKLQ